MRQNKISKHEVRFYLALERNKGRWATSQEISDQADVSYRTGRMFAKKFVTLGVAEVVKVFPGYRYRRAAEPLDYVNKLQAAMAVFGMKE